jgi:hypothetical protein
MELSSTMNKEAMMKKTYTLGATVVAGLVALALSAPPASAATASFPRVAKYYSAWFARAMDECVPGTETVTIVAPNFPSGGCPQVNVGTDSLLTLKWAKLLVTQRGKAVILGAGLPFGARLGLQLDLRFTVKGVHTKSNGTATVTFEDQTVNCPNLSTKPYGFPVRPQGTMSAVAPLADCLAGSLAGDYSNLAVFASNIEILGARLMNLDTGLPIAEAGVVR